VSIVGFRFSSLLMLCYWVMNCWLFNCKCRLYCQGLRGPRRNYNLLTLCNKTEDQNSQQHYGLCSCQLLVPNRPNTEYRNMYIEVYCHSVQCVYIFAPSLARIIKFVESTGFILVVCPSEFQCICVEGCQQ